MARLRAALSYREKVEGASRDARAALEARGMAPEEHDARRNALHAHLDRAEAATAAARQAIRDRIEQLAASLQAALARKGPLAREVAEGRLAAEEANRAGRALAAQVADLRATIRELNAAHAAQTSDDVGGFVDVPMDEYSRPDRPPRGRPARTPTAGAPAASTSTSRTWSDSPWLLVAAVAIGLAISTVVIWPMLPLGGGVAFEAALTADAPHAIAMTCRNQRVAPVALHVPWVDGRPGAPDGGAIAGAQYGLLVQVRETAAAPWRLLPNSEGCWLSAGRDLTYGQPVSIAPGGAFQFSLPLARLRRHVAAPEAVRLALTNGAGRRLAVFETALD